MSEQLHRVQNLISRIRATVLGTRFWVYPHKDKKGGYRLYLQVSYLAPCTKDDSDAHSTWFGRKFYLSDHMTDDEIVKTAWTAVKMAVEHEVMEGFKVDGKILFNPHTSFEALLSVSDKEVKRDPS